MIGTKLEVRRCDWDYIRRPCRFCKYNRLDENHRWNKIKGWTKLIELHFFSLSLKMIKFFKYTAVNKLDWVIDMDLI